MEYVFRGQHQAVRLLEAPIQLEIWQATPRCLVLMETSIWGGLDANLPSWAAAINSSGQIVGGAYSAYTTYIFDALIWEGGVMRTLDSLIDPASGWDLISANDINDMGQIAATGVDGNGNEHALLLTPISRNNVPEPATGLLIGTALFGLFATRRRVNRACHNSARSTPRGKSSTPIAVELIRPSTSPSRRIVT